ncbi:cytochrome b [Methylobacterium radiodurans]|uniref:cytochrome b n=1 Tax=Methylobacterium radiodurans TaxID=2202828 RepID=UPI0013A56BBE|nr:cytochrome b/b6 domain-containing protein [Methylobacterium radiodurans]
MTVIRYSRAHRLVHWTTAALVLSLLGLGLTMIDSLASWRSTGLVIHKAGGLTVFVLTAFRLGLLATRSRALTPPRPRSVQHAAAIVTHTLLYVLLVIVPLTGWAMQGAAGTPIVLPGGYALPQILSQNIVVYGALREAHGVLTRVLWTLILLHAGAALYHGLIRRDDVLERML